MNIISELKYNWKSGITVALVSIPLSVSLAVASGSTPTAGIITAIWAGIMAAIFGGSNYNIVGPTGALSGLLASFAILHGAEFLPMVAILSGVLVLISYALKLEKFLVFIPGSAIHGFTLGVAFIIAFNQMNFALGLTGLAKHEHFVSNLVESFKNIGAFNWQTTALFCIFLALMFAFLKFIPKLPGAIVLAPIGIALGYLAQTGRIPLNTLTLGALYPNITPQLFQMPTFAISGAMVSTAFAVALVAILETMLSAKIGDGMTKTKYNKRKEMFGLGVANLMSGLMGGIPGTAALARTSLNIKSGAKSRYSGIVSAICIALISLIFLKAFAFIPLAVIAAILVFVAIRMIERQHFNRMWHYDKKSLLVSFIVAFVTVYEDPIIGILLGVALSLILFMEKVSRGQFELIYHDPKNIDSEKIVSDSLKKFGSQSEIIIYSIKGQLAYINAQSHVERFEHGLESCKTVVLRLRELSFIDLDGIEALDEIIEHLWAHGIDVLISGVHPIVESMISDQPVYQKLVKDGKVFKRTHAALKYLGY